MEEATRIPDSTLDTTKQYSAEPLLWKSVLLARNVGHTTTPEPFDTIPGCSIEQVGMQHPGFPLKLVGMHCCEGQEYDPGYTLLLAQAILSNVGTHYPGSYSKKTARIETKVGCMLLGWSK